MINLHCLCATYKNMRINNQDNYYFNSIYANKDHNSEEQECFIADEDISVFGIFDGLGGEDKGEEASYIAAKSLSEFYDLDNIERYYIEANNKICNITIFYN